MTLYRRWPDTQTLLADLMTREWGHVVRRPRPTAPRATALDRIAAAIVATVQALRANALLRRIVDVDPEVLLPYLLDRRGRSQEMVADAPRRLIAQGQREKSIRRGDPVVLARSLLLACHGFVLSAHTMSERRRPASARRQPTSTPSSSELVRRYLAR